jgi:hypothetical protein
MIREFLAQVAAVEAELLAGKAFPDPSTMPVGDKEEVIGIVTDPWLRALVLAYNGLVDAAKTQAGERSREFDSGTLNPEKLGQMDRETSRDLIELQVLNELVWGELRIRFNFFGAAMGLRTGWAYVTVKSAPAQSSDIEELPPEVAALFAAQYASQYGPS